MSQDDNELIDHPPDPDVRIDRMGTHSKDNQISSLTSRKHQHQMCPINAPWYLTNTIIFRDLEQTPITKVLRDRAKESVSQTGQPP